MEGACVVIVNPAAGNGKAGRQWPSISEQLRQAGREHVAVLTRRPGEAIEVSRAMLRAGAGLIVAAGGDGTLNEVVNGFLDAASDAPVNPQACLGILPLGSGSDFARALRIGTARAAIPALAAGGTALLDVGRVDLQGPDGQPVSRYFLNVADLGLGAQAAYYVNRSRKTFGGFVSYLAGAVHAILAYRSQEVSLQLDGEAPGRGPTAIVVVANSRYFGGGMLIAPGARPDDGLFDVLRLASTSRGRMLVDILPRVYRGAHLRHPLVRLDRAARLTVASEGRFLLEVDGEQIGAAPASFRVLPRALRVVVPQAWQAAGDGGATARGNS